MVNTSGTQGADPLTSSCAALMTFAVDEDRAPWGRESTYSAPVEAPASRRRKEVAVAAASTFEAVASAMLEASAPAASLLLRRKQGHIDRRSKSADRANRSRGKPRTRLNDTHFRLSEPERVHVSGVRPSTFR
jgi:hypothetical protein